MFKRFSVCTFFLISLTPAISQEIDYSSIEVFNEKNGLSNNLITCMLYDSDGFIWIATLDGLNRYDGLSFKVFRHLERDSTSIPSNSILPIAEDPDKKHIWVGTERHVAKIDKYSFTSTNYEPGAKSGLPGDRILNLFFDRRGNFWVCIADKGLYSFDKKKNVFNHVVSLNNIASFYSSDQMRTFNSINKITEDEAGLFWMATSDGLYTYDPVKKKTQSIRSEPILSPDQIRNDLFVDVLLGNDGVWLASTTNGLAHFNTKTKVWQNFRFIPGATSNVNNIGSLAWKNNTQLWVTSGDAGFGFFDITEKTFHFDKQKKTFIAWPMIKDAAGIIWFGSSHGLNKYDPNQDIVFNKIAVEKSDNGNFYEAHGYYFDHRSNKFYVGTLLADGLHIMDNSKNEELTVRFPINPREREQVLWVSDILNDSKDTLWILTRDDLFICDKKSNKLSSFTKYGEKNSPFFSVLFESSDGSVWIGSYRSGLFKLNRSDGSLTQFKHDDGKNSILEGRIKTINENEDGDLFVGMGTGLSVYRVKTNRFENYQYDLNVVNSIPSNRISGSTVLPNNKIWLSTLGAGLIQCDEVDGKIVFKKINPGGINSNSIYCITTDKNGITWLLTQTNVIALDDHGNILYKQLQSIVRPIYNGKIWVDPKTDIVYFDGFGGYYSIEQRAFPSKRARPPIAVTSFKIFDREVPLKFDDQRSASLELEHNENFFSFELAVLDFKVPSLNRYSHYLENFDPGWVMNNESRYVSYTNVPPGHYNFKIRGANSLGEETEQIINIDIRISPPFWSTWWFRAISAITFFFLIYMFFKSRLNHFKQVERLKTEYYRKVLDAQLVSLRAQMNPHFLYNCLASINNYVLQSEKKLASEYITKFAKLMRLLLENSTERNIPLIKEIEYMRLYLEMESMRFDSGFEFEIIVDKKLDVPNLKIASMTVQPFVENAIKHGILTKKTKGKLQVSYLNNEDGFMKCVIEDDGVGRGISAELKSDFESRKSYGIKITSERLEMLKGTVQIIDLKNENGESCGTRILVAMPLITNQQVS